MSSNMQSVSNGGMPCTSDSDDNDLLGTSSSTQQELPFSEGHADMQQHHAASTQDPISSALCDMISKLSNTMDTITSRLQQLESTVQLIQTPGASPPTIQVEALSKQHPVNTSFTEKTSAQPTKMKAAFMTP